VSEPELVHPIPLDDADGWTRAFFRTLLLETAGDAYTARVANVVRDWDVQRRWGFRDAGQWVATLATEERRLSVPGAGIATNELVVDALTAVTVAATHRRRGLLTRMITESLTAAKERGDALSILIAAEWPIYGRYGYATAVDDASYVYFPRRPNAALAPPPAGRVRPAEPDEVATVADAIFDAARRLRPGQIDRPTWWWDRSFGRDGHVTVGPTPNWILHEGPGGPDGMLAWHVTNDFELDGRLGKLEVTTLVAANDTAYRDLWAYLGGIDVIEEITATYRPVDEPVRFLVKDGRALQETWRGDFLWVRLLDVPAALAARDYAVPGRLVLDVVDDDLGGFAAGRVLLEVDGDGARCTPTDEAAELRVSHRLLGSIYLGGHRLRQLAPAGGIEELTPGALDRADVMFSTPLAPYCQTFF
jgi:predicted acetyltransferase